MWSRPFNHCQYIILFFFSREKSEVVLVPLNVLLYPLKYAKTLNMAFFKFLKQHYWIELNFQYLSFSVLFKNVKETVYEICDDVTSGFFVSKQHFSMRNKDIQLKLSYSTKKCFRRIFQHLQPFQFLCKKLV